MHFRVKHADIVVILDLNPNVHDFRKLEARLEKLFEPVLLGLEGGTGIPIEIFTVKAKDGLGKLTKAVEIEMEVSDIALAKAMSMGNHLAREFKAKCDEVSISLRACFAEVRIPTGYSFC